MCTLEEELDETTLDMAGKKFRNKNPGNTLSGFFFYQKKSQKQTPKNHSLQQKIKQTKKIRGFTKHHKNPGNQKTHNSPKKQV